MSAVRCTLILAAGPGSVSRSDDSGCGGPDADRDARHGIGRGGDLNTHGFADRVANLVAGRLAHGFADRLASPSFPAGQMNE